MLSKRLDVWVVLWKLLALQKAPVEGRFAGDDQVSGKRLESSQQFLRIADLEILVQKFVSSRIDDADLQIVGMQVYSAVEFVLSVFEKSLIMSLLGLRVKQSKPI